MLNNINLDFLLSVEDYELELDTISLKGNDNYAIDMYFYGSENASKFLIDDPSRDYFLMRFEKYAVFIKISREYSHF